MASDVFSDLVAAAIIEAQKPLVGVLEELRSELAETRRELQELREEAKPQPATEIVYLSLPQVAERLGVSQRTARRWLDAGRLPCVPHHVGSGCGDSGPQWDSTDLGADAICNAAEPSIFGDCQRCISSRCCAELRGCLPADRCTLGGPAGEGEFACLTNCLALAFYSDQPLGAARLECASACSKPRPKPSAATTALLSCMLGRTGQEDSCIVQCLGAPLE